MKLLKKILVATDSRLSDQCIVEAAYQLAKHNGASLTIVTVVPRLNWAAKFADEDAKSLDQSLQDEASERLMQIVDPYLGKEVEVKTKLLEGKASINLIREVIAGDYDLLIAVSKGKASRRSGTFGQTAKQLLRNCPCPLLLTPRGVLPEFKHVTACVDTSSGDSLDAELNDKVYNLASAISQQNEARMSVLQAWTMEGEAILRTRLKPKVVDGYARSTFNHQKELLTKFLAQFRADDIENDIHLIKGPAPQTIGFFTLDHHVDLVVMGTVARSGLTGMLLGNTAEKILERIEWLSKF